MSWRSAPLLPSFYALSLACHACPVESLGYSSGVKFFEKDSAAYLTGELSAGAQCHRLSAFTKRGKPSYPAHLL